MGASPSGVLPASFGENGHALAARKVARAQQNAFPWDLNGAVNRAGHVPGVHISGMRHYAAESREFFRGGVGEFPDLPRQFGGISGIEAAGNSGGTNHGVFWHKCVEGWLMTPCAARLEGHAARFDTQARILHLRCCFTLSSRAQSRASATGVEGISLPALAPSGKKNIQRKTEETR